MIKAASSLDHAANIIAVEEVPLERIEAYGVVGKGQSHGDLFEVTGMVEKPKPGKAPSNLIITGRYILQPEIFNILATQKKGSGGEIQLTDAMLELAKRQKFLGYKFGGKSFDCGSKIGFLAANLSYALARTELGPALRELLKSALAETSCSGAEDVDSPDWRAPEPAE
jgi:UTP--glucose-1-phosphate uridylyltransferase